MNIAKLTQVGIIESLTEITFALQDYENQD